MRTTLNLDDELVTRTKILAIRRRTTLSSLIEEALQQLLDADAEHARPSEIDLPVSSGEPLPADFPWHSGSKMIEYIEGPSVSR